MAQRNQKVYERVRQELGKDPKLGSRELYAVAQSVDKAISGDSLQQFHARYVLPVKREQAAGARGGAPAARKPGRPRRAKAAAATATTGGEATARAPRRRRRSAGSDRAQIRAVLLQFAQELTDAESRSSLVQVLGRVDSYVDKIAPSKS
jgi:hypothetical protein